MVVVVLYLGHEVMVALDVGGVIALDVGSGVVALNEGGGVVALDEGAGGGGCSGYGVGIVALDLGWRWLLSMWWVQVEVVALGV